MYRWRRCCFADPDAGEPLGDIAGVANAGNPGPRRNPPYIAWMPGSLGTAFQGFDEIGTGATPGRVLRAACPHTSVSRPRDILASRNQQHGSVLSESTTPTWRMRTLQTGFL